MSASAIASLFGKNWYREPGDIPARAAMAFVVAASYPRRAERQRWSRWTFRDVEAVRALVGRKPCAPAAAKTASGNQVDDALRS